MLFPPPVIVLNSSSTAMAGINHDNDIGLSGSSGEESQTCSSTHDSLRNSRERKSQSSHPLNSHIKYYGYILPHNIIAKYIITPGHHARSPKQPQTVLWSPLTPFPFPWQTPHMHQNFHWHTGIDHYDPTL